MGFLLIRKLLSSTSAPTTILYLDEDHVQNQKLGEKDIIIQ